MMEDTQTEEEKAIDDSASQSANSPEGDSSENKISAEEARLMKENRALVKELSKLRRQKSGPDEQQQPAQKEQPVVEDDSDPVKYWNNKIATDAQAATAPIKQELDRAKQKYEQRAWGKFASEYPEYSEGKDPDGDKREEISAVIAQYGLAKDAFDAEDYQAAFKRAYAIINSDEILKRERRMKADMARIQMHDADFAADLGSVPSEREPVSDIAITDFDRKQARELGKKPEEVAKLRMQWEASQLRF